MADSRGQFSDSRWAGPRSGLIRFAQARPLTLFFLLAYAWSWTLWAIMLAAYCSKLLEEQIYFLPVALFIGGAFGPTVGALITRWLTHRDLKICPLWTGWRGLFAGSRSVSHALS